MASKLSGIELTRYDDLFKTDAEREADRQERIQIVPAAEVFPYSRQPYTIDRPTPDLVRLMDSIEHIGIAEPLIVRPREVGGYGVLFYPIVNKVEKTGTVEIMAKAKDAKQINRIFERMGYPAPVKEDTAAKKENARAPSENSSKERGTGARASTEPAAEKADARPSVRSRLMALQAAAERDGTAPTKDTVREAIQKAMPTRE